MCSAQPSQVWESLGSARAQLVLKFSRVVSLAHTWDGNSACVGCIGGQICIAVSMISIRLCQDGPCDSKSHAGIRCSFGCFVHRHHISLYPSSFGLINTTSHRTVPHLGLSKSHSLIHENSVSGFSEWLKGNNSLLSSQYRWMPLVCWGNAAILSTKSLVD